MYQPIPYRAASNQELVEYLKREGFIKSQRIFDVMSQVDRKNYVNNPYGIGNPSGDAYVDSALYIGNGRHISAPHMHATVLEILSDKLVNGSQVLSLGCSSGYLTTCMALLVGPKGSVQHLSVDEEVQKQLRRNISQDQPDLLTSGRIDIFWDVELNGDYYPNDYDVIYVGGAVSEIPQSVFYSLLINGSLLVPIIEGEGAAKSQVLTLYKRKSFSENGITKESLMPVEYRVLVENPVYGQQKTSLINSRTDQLNNIMEKKIKNETRLIEKELSLLKASIENKLAKSIIEKLKGRVNSLSWSKMEKEMIHLQVEEENSFQQKNKKNAKDTNEKTNARLMYCLIVVLNAVLTILLLRIAT